MKNVAQLTYSASVCLGIDTEVYNSVEKVKWDRILPHNTPHCMLKPGSF